MFRALISLALLVACSQDNGSPTLAAEQRWRAPNINERSAEALARDLDVLLRANPAHPRARVKEAYQRISRYFPTTEGSLAAAVAYGEGRSWNREQFDRIVELCVQLEATFDNRAWDLALGIAVRTGFDPARAALAARKAISLAEHGRIPRSDATSALATLFGAGERVLVSGT